MNSQEVKNFVDQLYIDMEVQGYGSDQQRQHLLEEIAKQAMVAERMLIMKIMMSPQQGFYFIDSVQTLLGNVNAVIVAKEQDPIHINELGLATVITATEFFENDIDSLYTAYKSGVLFDE